MLFINCVNSAFISELRPEVGGLDGVEEASEAGVTTTEAFLLAGEVETMCREVSGFESWVGGTSPSDPESESDFFASIPALIFLAIIWIFASLAWSKDGLVAPGGLEPRNGGPRCHNFTAFSSSEAS